MSKVVLQGFSGAGKTSVGRRLSEQFNLRLVDTDAAIERKCGKSITEFIRVEGEDRFRTLESEMLLQALNDETVQLISLGGGALIRKENREALRIYFCDRVGAIVHLAISPEIAAKRIEAEELAQKEAIRPLVAAPLLTASEGNQLERVRKLWKEREPLNAEADIKVWTDFISVDAVARVVEAEVGRLKGAEDLKERRKRKRKAVVIAFPSLSSGIAADEVVIGAGAVRELPERIREIWPATQNIALVADENVFQQYGKQISSQLRQASFSVGEFLVPAGERSKNVKLVEEFAGMMLSQGFSRDDVVVGFGGGVVGDLTGLLAALYMRGIGLVHVPTTVVAQVDSAIGGKTAVNIYAENNNGSNSAKNILGTFYPARLVVSDIDYLQSLPDREFIAGLAEVVKYGVVVSAEFFRWLEGHSAQVLKRDPASIQEIVEFCSRAKLDIVLNDMRDTLGQRAVLNFGHTIGHAVESLSGFSRYLHGGLHGEAVAVGMMAALRFGEQRGETKPEVVVRTETLLRTLNLPVEIPAKLLDGLLLKKQSNLSEVWKRAVKADKKRSKDDVNFVFAKDIGLPVLKRVTLSDVVRFVIGDVRK